MAQGSEGAGIVEKAGGSRVKESLVKGHPAGCTCQVCGSIWFVSLSGEAGLDKIRHFFKTGELT